jgi:hypothetical protein
MIKNSRSFPFPNLCTRWFQVALLSAASWAFQPAAQAQTWNAFNDFYVNVPAPGGYPQSAWIQYAGVFPGDTGLVAPNAWGYAGGNFNGGGAPSSVGTYLPANGGYFYPLTSGGTYAGSGESYLTGGTSFWIGYNDQYGIVGLPNGQTRIAKYTSEWYSGSPNYAADTENGSNDKYLWVQGTGLSSNTDGLGAIVTWTAPTSGTFQIGGSYVNGDREGIPTSFAIVDSLQNSLLSRTTLAPASSENTFSFTRTYSAGDVVQFQAGTSTNAQGSPLGLAVDIAQVTTNNWNAARDFYLSPTAAEWGGATSPSAAGSTWGYYAANVNGFGLPSQIGSYFTPTASASGTKNMSQYSDVAPIGAGTSVGAPGYAATGGSGFGYYGDTFSWGSSLGRYDNPWFGGAPGLSQGLRNLIWLQPTYLSNTNTAPNGPAEGIAPVLTWKAPSTGFYIITGQFVSGNQPANGASAAIVDSRGGTLMARTSLSNNTVNSFSYTKSYNGGDVVQFQVGSDFKTGNAVGLQVDVALLTSPTISSNPSASPIIAGQALSNSIITGGSVTPSGGDWAWVAPTTVPAVGTNSVAAVYTPALADRSNYHSVTLDLTVVVNPAPPAGPTFSSAYPGKALDETAPNGLKYLMNYAFGGNSTTPPQLPVQDTSDPTKLTLYAFVRTNDSTVTVVGESGASLTAFTNSPVLGVRTTDQTGTPDGTERRAFTVNASGDRLFLRLKATK